MDKLLMSDLERAVENNQTMMATTLILEAIKDLDDRLSKCTCGEKTKATTKKATRSKSTSNDTEDK